MKTNSKRTAKKPAWFQDLCRIIDSTDFKRNPYRGVITRVARDLHLDRSSVHNAIYVRRNHKMMTAVAREIKRIDQLAQEVLQ